MCAIVNRGLQPPWRVLGNQRHAGLEYLCLLQGLKTGKNTNQSCLKFQQEAAATLEGNGRSQGARSSSSGSAKDDESPSRPRSGLLSCLCANGGEAREANGAAHVRIFTNKTRPLKLICFFSLRTLTMCVGRISATPSCATGLPCGLP